MSDKDQKGFIVYGDTKAVVDELTNEQAGELFRGMLNYFVDGTDPEFSDVLKIAFIPIRQQMDRNSDKYAKMCDRNRKNAKMRWDAVGCDRMRSDAVDANINTNTNTNKDIDTNTESHESDVALSLISFLNEKTGSTYSDTEQIRDLIQERLDEGYTESDLRSVIVKKCSEWNCDGKMRSYLRPSTLFGDKFEEYLNGPEPMEVQDERSKSEKAERLRADLENKRFQLEQVQEQIDIIHNGGQSEVKKRFDELTELNLNKGILEQDIESITRRLEAKQ